MCRCSRTFWYRPRPSIRAGKVRGLAVGTKERVELLPGVPTVGEAGLPRYGMHHPVSASRCRRATPAEIVMRLNAAFNETLADKAVRQKMTEPRLHPGRRQAASLCRGRGCRDRQVAQGDQGLEHPRRRARVFFVRSGFKPSPPHSYGEVSASYADGGVMSTNRVAHDPSVADYRAHLPIRMGRKAEAGRFGLSRKDASCRDNPDYSNTAFMKATVTVNSRGGRHSPGQTPARRRHTSLTIR